MPYARLDERNRIVEWCYDKLDGLDVEFDNGEYVDENCIDGLDEFVIENGKAVYSPLPEKQVKRLKQKLADTDYISAKIMDSLAGCESAADLLAVIMSFNKEYGDKIADRKKWRQEINDLEVI